jgi:hypothetical protein
MYRVRPIFQNDHFGEYSNLTNSPASGHCLVFPLYFIMLFSTSFVLKFDLNKRRL